VRRLVACALVQALVVSTAAGASLHVHEHLGHDHPEHHHGPASHEHHHAAIADEDHHDETEDHDLPTLRADSCDSGQHAVVVRMGCAQVPPLHVDIAELTGPPILVPAAPVESVALSRMCVFTVRRSILEFPPASRPSLPPRLTT
jgi:hypothetical protein